MPFRSKARFNEPEPKPREEFTAEDKASNVRMNPEVQKDWLRHILNEDPAKWNHWESKFIYSMSRLLTSGYKKLNENQAAALERLYVRCK